MSQEKSKALFICYTPLHILIAENIIIREKLSNYIFIFYCKASTKKLQLYYNRLANNAQYAFILKKDNKVITFIKEILPFIFKVKKLMHPNSIVYSGNIKSAYTRCIVFGIRTKNIHSFDDGSGNISGKGYFYKGRTLSFINKFLHWVGLDFSYARAYSMIEKHYTIYPNIKNAMPHTEEISVFDPQKNNPPPKNTKIILFLLTTFYEEGYLDEKTETKLFDKIIKTHNIEHVIPHPLSNKKKIEYYKKITMTGEKIAEEIIFDLKKKYSEVVVYGFHSSALVNLMNIKGVKCINIKIEGHKKLASLGQFIDRIEMNTITVNINTL